MLHLIKLIFGAVGSYFKRWEWRRRSKCPDVTTVPETPAPEREFIHYNERISDPVVMSLVVPSSGAAYTSWSPPVKIEEGFSPHQKGTIYDEEDKEVFRLLDAIAAEPKKKKAAKKKKKTQKAKPKKSKVKSRKKGGRNGRR